MTNDNSINKKTVKNKNKPTDKWNSTSIIATLLLAAAGVGFGTASYIDRLNYRMDIIELKNEHQKEIESIKEKYSVKQEQPMLTEKDIKLFIDNYNKRNNAK